MFITQCIPYNTEDNTNFYSELNKLWKEPIPNVIDSGWTITNDTNKPVCGRYCLDKDKSK